ncbi:MAG: hypothetical protein PWP24_1785, partial [Clostridiales bacterium]|nr:hypothetical protein [Clostridiales bacterium]
VASAHEFLDRDEEGAYPYMGFVLEGAGLRIYHPGDTCIYEGYFQKLRDLGAIDIMFLPINGRDGKRYQSNIIGNMTYQEAVDLAGAMHPGLVVPGHYEMFEGNRENPALFEDYLKAKYKGVPYWIGEHGSLCVYQTKKQGVEGR